MNTLRQIIKEFNVLNSADAGIRYVGNDDDTTLGSATDSVDGGRDVPAKAIPADYTRRLRQLATRRDGVPDVDLDGDKEDQLDSTMGLDEPDEMSDMDGEVIAQGTGLTLGMDDLAATEMGLNGGDLGMDGAEEQPTTCACGQNPACACSPAPTSLKMKSVTRTDEPVVPQIDNTDDFVFML